MEAANSGIQVEYGGIYIDEFSKMVASVLHIVSTLELKNLRHFWNLHHSESHEEALQPEMVINHTDRVGTSLGKDSP